MDNASKTKRKYTRFKDRVFVYRLEISGLDRDYGEAEEAYLSEIIGMHLEDQNPEVEVGVYNEGEKKREE